MSEEKQYPASSTYAISDYFRSLAEVEKVVDDMYHIKHECELLCFYRGDMTGRVYGSSYRAVELAAELLPEYERKLASHKDAVRQLKIDLPAADYEHLMFLPYSEEHNRKAMKDCFNEIKKFFDLTHDYYKQNPAPQRIKNSMNNALAAVGLVSIIYTVWHLIF